MKCPFNCINKLIKASYLEASKKCQYKRKKISKFHQIYNPCFRNKNIYGTGEPLPIASSGFSLFSWERGGGIHCLDKVNEDFLVLRIFGIRSWCIWVLTPQYICVESGAHSGRSNWTPPAPPPKTKKKRRKKGEKANGVKVERKT